MKKLLIQQCTLFKCKKHSNERFFSWAFGSAKRCFPLIPALA
jgi:hypothetical protein